MPALTVNEIIRTVTVEKELTREVSIPARLDPAQRIVSVNARVQVTSVRVGNGVVEVTGNVRYTVFYEPEDEGEPLESFTRLVGFTETLSVPGARSGLDASIDVLVEDIDWELLSPRRFLLTFLLSNDVELFRPERVGIIGEREGVRVSRYTVQRVVQEITTQRSFTRRIRLTSDQPAIDRVISLEPTGKNFSAEVGRDVVVINGYLELGLLYRPVGQFELRFTTIRIPVNVTVSVPGARPGMDAFVDLFVQEIEIFNQTERELTVRINTAWEIIVITEEEVEYPTDIIGEIPGLIPTRREFLIDRIIVQQRTRILASDTIELSTEAPGVERIIRATGRLQPGLVVQPESGGVTVSGQVVVDLIYVGNRPTQPVYYVSETIDFSRFLDIEAIRPGMQVRIEGEVVQVRTDIISPYEVRVGAVIDLRILVIERVPVSVITRYEEPVEVIPEEKAPGGTFVYTVRQGDTLYLIAQRYNTSIEALIELNNLQNPNALNIGQRLLIPR
ncbi:MAG: SPOCS domain-containing protein [Halanaerobium sp.]|nr:SPOCS domain-containing protein [Halanaerobium sp.]